MNIHFIGIGGVSMSGLAFISKSLGHNVSGSDINDSLILQKLENSGISIFRNQSSDNINKNVNLVVYTAAVLKDNPEFIKAKELENEGVLKVISRADFLGNLMKEHTNSIAISGTHGKTSTTSMVSSIFVNSNLNPTISVGGNLDIINGNYRIGNKDYFITEACEYVNSFLALKPKFSIILNIDFEHIDFFKDENMLLESFLAFANNTQKDGKVIANGDDLLVRKALDTFDNVLYFGFSDINDYIIKNISPCGIGNMFDLYKGSEFIGTFQINVIGEFNILNATSAIIVALLNNLSVSTIFEGLSLYKGVGRRFELKGDYNGANLFDDYAHHPSEVKSTLNAIAKFKKNNLITVFQPHTFSRTHAFLDDFSESFYGTDTLIITDIYPSREKDTGLIHSKDLYERMKDKLEVIYIKDFEEIANYIKDNCKNGDIVLTMGAGDVNKILDLILK